MSTKSPLLTEILLDALDLDATQTRGGVHLNFSDVWEWRDNLQLPHGVKNFLSNQLPFKKVLACLQPILLPAYLDHYQIKISFLKKARKQIDRTGLKRIHLGKFKPQGNNIMAWQRRFFVGTMSGNNDSVMKS